MIAFDSRDGRGAERAKATVQWTLRGYMDGREGRPYHRAPRGRKITGGRCHGVDRRWRAYMDGLSYGVLSKRPRRARTSEEGGNVCS